MGYMAQTVGWFDCLASVAGGNEEEKRQQWERKREINVLTRQRRKAHSDFSEERYLRSTLSTLDKLRSLFIRSFLLKYVSIECVSVKLKQSFHFALRRVQHMLARFCLKSLSLVAMPKLAHTHTPAVEVKTTQNY